VERARRSVWADRGVAGALEVGYPCARHQRTRTRPGAVRRCRHRPTRSLAKRYGLKQGGTVVIRPDGYLGAVIDIADDTKLSRYFAQLKS
jgi:hypothetical protein